MRSLSLLGSLGGGLQAIYLVAVVFFALSLLPQQGFAADEAAYHTPATALTFILNSPLRVISEALDLLMGLGLALFVGAFSEIFKPAERLRRYWLWSATSMSVGLFITSGVVNVVVLPQLAAMYQAGQSPSEAAYLTVTLITGAMRLAGIMTYGWSVLLISLLGLNISSLSKPLNYLGLVLGAAGIFNFIFQPLAIVVVMLGVIWAVWFSITLLRYASP